MPVRVLRGTGVLRSVVVPSPSRPFESLGAPDSTVRRWLAQLVELEYLDVETGSQGKAVRYRLSARAPMQDGLPGLLTPAELRKRFAGSATSPHLASPRGDG
jgi:hypothetical protein